jgi:hypothetical protein
MGTTLTGTTPQDTYDSLIKVTDNGPIGATAKLLSDGLGNDSALALSTSAVGIGTTTLSGKLSVEATGNHLTLRASTAVAGKYWALDVTAANQLYLINNAGTQYLTITDTGNVGIGTSTPSVKTEISGSASGDFAALALTNTNQAGTADAATLSFKLGRSVDSFLFTVPAIKFVKEQQWTSAGGTIDGALAFSTIANEATTEQARITSGGVLQLTQGQIKFPVTQVASADPNTLDDYEEGTWTPVLRGAAAAGTYELAETYAVYSFEGVEYAGDIVTLESTSPAGSTAIVYFRQSTANSSGSDLQISAFAANDLVKLTYTYFV